jgi:hypothetical protein
LLGFWLGFESWFSVFWAFLHACYWVLVCKVCTPWIICVYKLKFVVLVWFWWFSVLNICGFCVKSVYLIVVVHEMSVFQGFECIFRVLFWFNKLVGCFWISLANALTLYSMFIGFSFLVVGKREFLDLEI